MIRKADDMKMFWVSCTIGLGLGLAAGCQPEYWYQEGRTFDECRADHADCRAELIKRTDRHHMSDYERRFMEHCMEQRGYRLVPDNDLPLDVKREEPNVVTAVPWNRFHGIAGSLEEPIRKRPVPPQNLRQKATHLIRDTRR